MRVRFLQDRSVKDHNDIVVESFTAGRVYDLPMASARRWIRRAVAEEDGGPAPEAPAPVVEETPPQVEPVPEVEPSPTEGESEAGKEAPLSSLQVDPALPSETSNTSGNGGRRRRRRAKSQ